MRPEGRNPPAATRKGKTSKSIKNLSRCCAEEKARKRHRVALRATLATANRKKIACQPQKIDDQPQENCYQQQENCHQPQENCYQPQKNACQQQKSQGQKQHQRHPSGNLASASQRVSQVVRPMLRHEVIRHYGQLLALASSHCRGANAQQRLRVGGSGCATVGVCNSKPGKGSLKAKNEVCS